MPQPQPPTSAPPAPDAPAPPTPAAPPARAAEQTALTSTPPSNVEQVRGLRERREILGDELRTAAESREELLRSLTSGATPPEGRSGVEQRLRVLDERIVQLEQDLATSGRQLAATPPEVLAQTIEPEGASHPGMIDDDDAMGMMVGGFTFGILVALVASRIARWRRRRRGEPDARALAAQPDPRLERLAQAVDTMALEVERIGEGQRFVTQLLAEQRQPLVK